MTKSTQLYANNARSTLTSAIISSDTTIQVSDGSRFPSPTGGNFFVATLESGSTIEIVYVYSRSGNAFTGVLRAQENTVASNFAPGARIDNRVTRDTLVAMARKVDVMYEVASIDDLATPVASNSASYICHSNDDSGNTVVAVKNTNSSWRFSTHRIITVSGSATSGNSLSVVSTPIGSNITNVTDGKYIIQFITGSNAGLARRVISSTTNTVNWLTALPTAVIAGDQYEIYKSDASIITDLLNSADDGLVYSILLSD
jgi:hypothetical protein